MGYYWETLGRYTVEELNATNISFTKHWHNLSALLPSNIQYRQLLNPLLCLMSYQSSVCALML